MAHIKSKNVGLIFELIAHKIIKDILENKDINRIISICQKHFKKDSLIAEEYGIYQALSESRFRTTGEASSLIIEVEQCVKNINEKELEKSSQRLLSDIHKIVPLKEFFKQPIKNYRLFASIQQYLSESRKDESKIDSIIEKRKHKNTIVEHLLSNKRGSKNIKKELKEMKKNKIDNLTYLIMIEQFNHDYKDLLPEQKEVINEYLSSMDNKKRFEIVLKDKASKIDMKLKTISNLFSDNLKLNVKLGLVRKKLGGIVKDHRIANSDNLLLVLESFNLIKELQQLKNQNKGTQQ